MAENYAQHLKNLKAKQAASAQLAVDFMDGDQLDHMENFLSQKGIGIKNWEKRGVMALAEYLTGEVIEKSAQTYQEQPSRILLRNGEPDQASTAKYLQLLEDSNAEDTLEHADALARLLKCAIVLVQYSKETKSLFLTVLSQHNADVHYNRATGKIERLFYSTGTSGVHGGQLYHYWTDKEIKTLELDTTGKVKATPFSEANTYGTIPTAKLYDINPPRFGFWPKKVWEPLVQLNIALNFSHSEVKFNQRFQSFGQLFSNVKIPDGVVMGPDVNIEYEQTHPDIAPVIEYKVPQIAAGMEAFKKWFNDLVERVGSQWGVNIRMAGEGSADSGFKLIVEELPGLQLRKKRHKPAAKFEKELYQAIKVVAQTAGLASLPDDVKIKVDFPKPDLPVNEKEKAEVDSIKLANKLISREEIWKRDDPNITEEQIEERKAKIDADSQLVAPDFGDIEEGV